ncbi:hypothetical protein FJZ31_16320 [Candidatus Poribacteria bacterium]|nr:hypothetical protein [Candidatus Poribacteria bacterium]
MNERLFRLAQRVSNELNELEQVVGRIQQGWYRTQQSGDDLYLDGVALNLHGFYSGLERIFERIATTIDESLPQGANWHQVLLKQMETEISHVRPAVISEATCKALDGYRGFRHIVRNIYTFRFDVTKMQKLLEEVPLVFAQVRAELLAFAAFLETSV